MAHGRSSVARAMAGTDEKCFTGRMCSGANAGVLGWRGKGKQRFTGCGDSDLAAETTAQTPT
jgi:hypothetical protein